MGKKKLLQNPQVAKIEETVDYHQLLGLEEVSSLVMHTVQTHQPKRVAD
jgi:hypothetical protein